MPIEEDNADEPINVDYASSNALGVGIQAISRMFRDGQKSMVAVDYSNILNKDNNEFGLSVPTVIDIKEILLSNRQDINVDYGSRTVDFIVLKNRHKPINKVFFKSNPMWNKLFVKMASRSPFIMKNLYWEKTIELINNNKNVLKNKITPFKYIKLVNCYKRTHSDVLEGMHKDIQDVVIDHKTKKFINGNFKTKFSHLINSDVKIIISDFFRSSLDEKLLKTQITSRIYTIKNSKDLIARIKSLISKSLNWEKEIILKKIINNDVKILSSRKNVIIVEVRSYKELCLFAPETWCIKTDRKMFESSLNKVEQQIIKMDFNKLPNNPDSLIGITLSIQGEVTDAHDRNNNNILNKVEARKYKKYKLSDDEFLKHIVASDMEIKHILTLILREKKHLFEFFMKNYEERLSCFKVEYLCCKYGQTIRVSNVFWMMRDIYDFNRDHVLAILLTENHTKELKIFLNVMKDKIELPRLVFSTIHKDIKEETKNMIFSWVKEQLENKKNG